MSTSSHPLVAQAQADAAATKAVALRLVAHVPPEKVVEDLVQCEHAKGHLEVTAMAATKNLREATTVISQLQTERKVLCRCALCSCQLCLFSIFPILATHMCVPHAASPGNK